MARRIGIAVISQAGTYLVGVRPAGKPLAGYSEFPGGKCEPGEDSDRCAERECAEETGLQVRATRRLLSHRYRYAHGELELDFWECQPTDPTALPQHGFRWVDYAELFQLTFPEANQPLMTLLRERGF